MVVEVAGDVFARDLSNSRPGSREADERHRGQSDFTLSVGLLHGRDGCDWIRCILVQGATTGIRPQRH